MNMIDWVFLFALGTLTIVAVVLPLRARTKWKGPWKQVANLPLIMLTLVVLNILIGITLNPSSHNLFPFEIFIWRLVFGAFEGGSPDEGLFLQSLQN